MSDQPLAVGIDLGTTHSVVAVLDPDGPRVITDELGHSLIPSIVALDDSDTLVVGHPARERLARGVPHAVSRFKSDMGAERAFTFGERTLGPTALSSLILRDLREMASAALDQRVDRAVISVPAWFHEPQRRATLEAARLAGLEVLRLVNEPTAAALHYGLGAGDDPVTVAVLDLGGGTFDLTLLELFDGVADVRGSVGDVHLGGEDVTDAIVDWGLKTSATLLPDPADRARLRVAAERAKHQLTHADTTQLQVGDQLLDLDRPTFDRITADFRHRLTRSMREALLQTGLRADQIDDVLLVGGATRMPLVAAAATEVFDKAPHPLKEVDHAVALGAAIQAGLVLDHDAVRERLVTDVLTHSLGVAICRTWGDQVFYDRFDPVLHRGTTLPTSRATTYSTMHHEQSEVRLRIFEGERRDATENQLLGEVSIRELPPLPESERHDLEVRFTHDVSGLLEVETKVTATGQQARTVIERGGAHFTKEERAEIVVQLARLKTHPRDLLPNRWLIERATRVVELLTGPRRTELDQHLTAFEATLERGEPESVDALRTSLTLAVKAAVKDAGLELDPVSILRDLRARLGPEPRALEVSLPGRPEWSEEDALGAIWAHAPQIAAKGTVVLGWVVMANAKLWQPGEHDHPAGAVYSFDDACADPPQLLEPASSRLYAMYKDAPEPVGPSPRPWTRAIQDQIHTGFERPFHQPLSPDLTGGPVMYHTTLLVFRDHLPDGVLRSSVLPMLVDRDGSQMALIIPHAHWPDSLRRFMSRH